MRRIIASLFTTVDGVVEAPEKWHFPYFNEEMGAIVGSLMRDTQLVGRKSYETFASSWPHREAAGGPDAALATQIGDARKIVVSNQQLEFTWRNSEQLEGELIDTVIALKAEPGGDIATAGSVSIVRQLLDRRADRRAASARRPDRGAQWYAAVRRSRFRGAARADLLRRPRQRRPPSRLRPRRDRTRRNVSRRRQGDGRRQPVQLTRFAASLGSCSTADGHDPSVPMRVSARLSTVELHDDLRGSRAARGALEGDSSEGH